MDRQASPAGWLSRRISQRRAAAAPYHGLLIFLGQILLVLLVPLFDHGEHSTPLPLALAAVAMALASLALLGYRTLPSVLAVVAVVAFLWAWSCPEAGLQGRGPAILVLMAAYSVTVYLSVYYALNAEMRPSQRILCGAASFVMLGFLFTAFHGVVATWDAGRYVLAEHLEGGRALRWVDFLWLSFSTLTTAGYSDTRPVGTWPCAVATLEGLCGILYPATLIARIAALPAAGESGKCW
jgi:hypothetical protein